MGTNTLDYYPMSSSSRAAAAASNASGQVVQKIGWAAMRSLWNPRTFSTLASGTLLGSAIWGSFVAGVIAYKTLPRQILPLQLLWLRRSWDKLALQSPGHSLTDARPIRLQRLDHRCRPLRDELAQLRSHHPLDLWTHVSAPQARALRGQEL